MIDGFPIGYLILLVIVTGLLGYVTFKWRSDKNRFKSTLSITTTESELNKQYAEKIKQIQEMNNLLSQNPIVNYDPEPPKYEGRWQDPDHQIISGEGGKGWEDPDHPILR